MKLIGFTFTHSSVQRHTWKCSLLPFDFFFKKVDELRNASELLSLFFHCGLETGESFAAAGCSLPQPFCPAVGTFADAQALRASSVQGLLLSSPVAGDKFFYGRK